MRRLGPFSGFKILHFNYFWGFSEKLIFSGYEDFVDILGGHHKGVRALRGYFGPLLGQKIKVALHGYFLLVYQSNSQSVKAWH